MDVKIFKLISGEEIIASLEKFEDGMLYLDRPLGIGIDHQQQRLVFVPYMPYSSAKDEIVLHSSSLLQEPVTPIDSIASDYANATGRVFVPTKSLIRPVT